MNLWIGVLRQALTVSLRRSKPQRSIMAFRNAQQAAVNNAGDYEDADYEDDEEYVEEDDDEVETDEDDDEYDGQIEEGKQCGQTCCSTCVSSGRLSQQLLLRFSTQ